LKIPYYSVVKDRIKTPLILKERSGIRTFKRSRHQGRPFTPGSEKLSYCWWSGPGLNRQPPACKADALPIELPPPIPLHSELDSPQTPIKVVGPGRVELPTLPLSGARSSQLSYGPSRFAGGLRLSGLSGDDALTASLSKPPTPPRLNNAIELPTWNMLRCRPYIQLRSDAFKDPCPLRDAASQNQIVVRAGVKSIFSSFGDHRRHPLRNI
jgi:hypothetical protein